MTLRLCVRALVAGLILLTPFLAFAGCEELLARQIDMDQLVSALRERSPSSAPARLRLVWTAPSLTRGRLNALIKAGESFGAKVSVSEFAPFDSQVAAIFMVSGPVDGLLAFVRALPEFPDRFTWADLRVSVEKKLGWTPDHLADELNLSGFAIVPFTRSEHSEGEKIVLVQLGNEPYVAPRIAYLLKTQALHPLDLGNKASVLDLIESWPPGEFAFGRTNGKFYVLLSSEHLEELREVRTVELRQAGIDKTVDVEQFLTAAAFPRSSPPNQSSTIKIKRPITYSTTAWLSGKYKSVFKVGPTRLSPSRPFAVISWSKIPALGVLHLAYLRAQGAEQALSTLGELVADLREPVRQALTEVAQGAVPSILYKESQLGGSVGRQNLDRLMDEQTLAIVTPAIGAADAVVIFPLGRVRGEGAQEPPAEAVSIPGPDSTSESKSESGAPRRAKVIFANETDYQSKIADLDEFEFHLREALKDIPHGTKRAEVQVPRGESDPPFAVRYRLESEDQQPVVRILKLTPSPD